MEKWADYIITKVSYAQFGNNISNVIVRPDNGDLIGNELEMTRNTITQHFATGRTFVTARKSNLGQWHKENAVYYHRNYFSDFISIYQNPLKDDLGELPLDQTKRKTFISYYHKDNEGKKNEFINLTDDLIVNKSVGIGDINSEISEEYIKQLIQKEYLKDTTVLVVLIGNKTKCRKHIDWEISGALNYKVGDTYSGLLGLLLPDHSDYGTTKATYDLMPTRLADNFKSGYAIIRDWTENRKSLQSYIEAAFSNRSIMKDKRVNSMPQMKNNTCD